MVALVNWNQDKLWPIQSCYLNADAGKKCSTYKITYIRIATVKLVFKQHFSIGHISYIQQKGNYSFLNSKGLVIIFWTFSYQSIILVQIVSRNCKFRDSHYPTVL